MPNYSLDEIFHPGSIAIIGASPNPTAQGYGFTLPLKEMGYKGKVYPVNPKYQDVLGYKSYPTLKDIPGNVDYVISCVPAREVLAMMDDCPAKGVKAIHVFTARFSETGRKDAAELEKEILKKGKQIGIRLLGPNGAGLYDPKLGVSMRAGMPRIVGTVGMAAQSGGVVTSTPPLAATRGIFFSRAISYGNAIDLNEGDYLDYLAHDPDTKIIMMYIEGVRDGKRFFKILREATRRKPVIITKGGKSRSGLRAASSHTASLTSSTDIWQTVFKQANAIPAENADEMVDLGVAFHYLPEIKNRRVGILGGGGGAGVMAADECESAGLDVIPLPKEIRDELKRRNNPVWDWIGNPADMSIDMGDPNFTTPDMLKLMAEHPDFDFLFTNMGAPMRQGQEFSIEDYIKPYKNIADNIKPVVAIVAEKSLGIDDCDSVNWKQTCEVRTKLIEAGIPFFPTIGRAAKAVSKLITYYQQRG